MGSRPAGEPLGKIFSWTRILRDGRRQEASTHSGTTGNGSQDGSTISVGSGHRARGP